jgi:hypothetical protein
MVRSVCLVVFSRNRYSGQLKVIDVVHDPS